MRNNSLKRCNDDVALSLERFNSILELVVQGDDIVLTFDDMIASPGGIPLVENGKIVGATGCSGGASSQDEVLCQAVMGPPYKTDFSATD